MVPFVNTSGIALVTCLYWHAHRNPAYLRLRAENKHARYPRSHPCV